MSYVDGTVLIISTQSVQYFKEQDPKLLRNTATEISLETRQFTKLYSAFDVLKRLKSTGTQL